MKPRRIGKIDIDMKLVESGEALAILHGIRMTPVRAEIMDFGNHVEYQGISPLFDEMQPGLIMPFYVVIVTETEDGRTYSVERRT